MLRDQVHDLLHEEAASLDEQRWDDWLSLWTADCEYWIPAWKGDHEPTSDPAAEVSLIYYDSRARLEERIARIRTGLSAASTPLPRTLHLVSNVRVGEPGPQGVRVHTHWQVHAWQNRATDTLYGRSEYLLVQDAGCWRIRRRKAVVLNDVIRGVMDVYHV